MYRYEDQARTYRAAVDRRFGLAAVASAAAGFRFVPMSQDQCEVARMTSVSCRLQPQDVLELIAVMLAFKAEGELSSFH